MDYTDQIRLWLGSSADSAAKPWRIVEAFLRAAEKTDGIAYDSVTTFLAGICEVEDADLPWARSNAREHLRHLVRTFDGQNEGNRDRPLLRVTGGKICPGTTRWAIFVIPGTRYYKHLRALANAMTSQTIGERSTGRFFEIYAILELLYGDPKDKVRARLVNRAKTLLDDSEVQKSFSKSLFAVRARHPDLPTYFRRRPLQILGELASLIEREVDFPVVSSLSRLPSTRREFVGRSEQLEALDEAWSDPRINIVIVQAMPGVGKTALVEAWLKRTKGSALRGARRQLAWSFQGQHNESKDRDTSEFFIQDALSLLGESGPPTGMPWERGRHLAKLITHASTIVVLDGLESLQCTDPPQIGAIMDPGMICLLKELAWHNNGLCLITTRAPVSDLDMFVDSSVKYVYLPPFSQEEGVEYLGLLGFNGRDQDLQNAVSDSQGNPLMLGLLARYLRSACGGDVRQRDRIRNLFSDTTEGSNALQILAVYEDWLRDTKEIGILRMLSLFDGPAEQNALASLLRPPPIANLTEDFHPFDRSAWNYGVQNLRDLDLIEPSKAEDVGQLDCHPLIRQYFRLSLKSHSGHAWTEGHRRLYHYHSHLPRVARPATLKGLLPLYAAVRHACEARDYVLALNETYRARIQRNNTAYSTKVLGAFSTDLACLSNFFDSPWERPASQLDKETHAFLLNLVGHRLRALGRLHESERCLGNALKIHRSKHQWYEAAEDAGSRSEILMMTGNYSAAHNLARTALVYARKCADPFMLIRRHTTFAFIKHVGGRFNQAEKQFLEGEAILRRERPDLPILFSVSGFRYCQLLLNTGKYEEALLRAKRTIKWARSKKLKLDTALDLLTIAQAETQKATLACVGGSERTIQRLNTCVEKLRDSNAQEFLILGLLARSHARRTFGDFEGAIRDVLEANENVMFSNMEILACDMHVECARLILMALQARKDLQRFIVGKRGPFSVCVDEPFSARAAEVHLQQATRLATATGYLAPLRTIEMDKSKLSSYVAQRRRR